MREWTGGCGSELRKCWDTGSKKAGPLSADRATTADPWVSDKLDTSSSPLSSSQVDSYGWLWTGRKGSRCAGWILALLQTPAPSVGGRGDTAVPAGCRGVEGGPGTAVKGATPLSLLPAS